MTSEWVSELEKRIWSESLVDGLLDVFEAWCGIYTKHNEKEIEILKSEHEKERTSVLVPNKSVVGNGLRGPRGRFALNMDAFWEVHALLS